MRRFLLFIIAVFGFSLVSFGQDFTNKGKDFWVGYGYHQAMNNGGTPNSQDMVLYFATDQITTITVSIPGLGYTATYPNIPANTVFTTPPMPKTGVNDARLLVDGLNNKGIHVVATKPIVSYAHIYNQSVSGACVMLPTNTLGKEYYSINYKNVSNSINSNSWFYVVATEPGITAVEITPSNTTTNSAWLPGFTYVVNLNQGQIYNVMGGLLPNTNVGGVVYNAVDLTGSKIKSVSTGTQGCKKIAVYSGSGRISITCPNTTSASSDNYMVQAFPKTAWGRKFLTATTGVVTTNPNGTTNASMTYNIYRICVSNPAAIVKINNVVTTLPLQNGFYYETASTNIPLKIESDSTITVAQYITSQSACNNSTPGDPEVIYLSPVEQNIKKVLFNSNLLVAVGAQKHFVNAIIPNGGTALSSFRLDGAIPNDLFVIHPQDPNFSYIKIDSLALGAHTLVSDSGFNAIAYGFAPAESYGYNAGTNVLDLIQSNSLVTQYGQGSSPTACTGAPFKFRISLGFKPLKLTWNLNVIPGMLPNNNNVVQNPNPSCTLLSPAEAALYVCPDSITIVNGKEKFWYSLPTFYTINTIATYPINIDVITSNTDGCGTNQDIDFDLDVSAPPIANFTYNLPNCYAESVQFNDASNTTLNYKWYWTFGEPSSGNADTSYSQNPTHTYAGPGTYNVRFASITTPGCLSDTITKQVIVPAFPTGTISGTTSLCINAPAPTITFTGAQGTKPYEFTYNINGGTSQTIQTIGTSNSVTINPPTNVDGIFTYNLTNIRCVNSTICTTNISNQSAIVTVLPDATLTLSSALPTSNQTICINNAIANITYAVGGSGTGGSVSGLPAGVTGTYAGGVITISGTPTVSGTFNYTVSTTGPCVKPSLSGIINVTADATLALSSAISSTSQTICINTPLSNITYSVAASGTGGSVSGLPAGITGTYASGVITISGTPTVSGTFNYTVSTTGPCVTPSLTGVINVTADATLSLSSSAATTSQTICINTILTNITYTVGASGTGGSVSGLPTGVTGTYAGGVITISGTPTVSGTFNYTVSTTGPCVKPSLGGVINVTADATLGLTSAASTASQTICINTALNNITYSVGGTGTGGSVSGLPTGVTGTYAGGIITITGTPTVSGTFNYTVNTTGPCVKPSLTGVINVTADATLALTSAATTTSQTICINTVLTNITYAVAGTGTGGSVTGLPTGVTGTFAGGVITISGTPTLSGTFIYTVNTTGPCVKPTFTGLINVTADATLALTSAAATTSQTICINTLLNNITYSVGGTGNGGSVTGLPSGVTGTYSGGVITISGIPTVSGTFNYTVNTTGPCIKPSLTGVINVTANATIALSSAPATSSQSLCINTPITAITYAVGGTGTGGSVAGLPTGVTGSFSGGVITISGSSSVTGTFNYTVSTTGPCVKPSATGSIIITPDATIALSSAAATTSQQLCLNFPINNITYQIAAGGTGATVTGLPAGVTGSYVGGVFTLSGSPSVSGLFNYTVTTTGTCVQKTEIGSITVHPKPTASYAVSAPYCAQNAVTITPTFGITPTGSVVSWVWNYGDGTGTQVRPNGLPFNITYATAGVKPVSFKVISDKGCESILATTPAVIINSKPKAGFINPAACLADAQAQFTDTSTVVGGTIVFWEWDFGDGTPILTGGTAAAQNPLHTYLAVGQKTVRLIVTTNSGCKDTITQQFFINGEVTSADFIPQGNFCSNRPVKIKENSVVNVGGLIRVDIYWDNLAAPTIVDQDNSPTPGKLYYHSYPNLQIDKTYSVRYIAYSGFNGVCQQEITKNIVVHASPVASFAPPMNVCLNGGSVQLTGTEIGGVGGTTVYMGTGVSATGLFNPITAGSGTNNNITFTAISPNTCDSALVRPIHVLIPPVANFATVGNLCVGPTNVVTFHQTSTVTAGEGGAIVKWIYDWGDGTPVQTFTNGADVTHAYATAGPKTARLIVEDAFGCRNAAPGTALNFTVNPLPVPSYTFTNTICLPNANINFTNTTASVASNTYTWSFQLPSTAPLNVSTLTNPSHIYTSQGPHNTHLIATNIATGCKDSTAVIVINSTTIHPAPVVAFATMADICLNNGTRQLTQGSETSGIAGTGVYSGPGVSATGLFNPITAGVGTHTITYTFTSTFNCPTSITNTIKVLAPPVVNTFVTVGNKCVINNTTFANTTTSTAGTVVSWIYNWGDVSAVQTNTTGANTNHIYAIAANYTPTLTLITDYGCTSSPAFPLTVTINPLPVPSYTFTNSTCLPSANITFTNTSANIAANTYNWSFELPSTASANVSTVTSPSHVYTSQGPFSTQLVATNSTTGCKDSTAVVVINSTTIHPAPVVAFAPMADICLNNGTRTIIQGSETSGIAGTAVYSGPGISATGLFNPITAGVGTHIITYTFTSTFGCPTSITGTIKVLAAPVVNTFTTIGNVCEVNGTVFHNTTTSTAGVVAQWIYNWGDGTSLTMLTGIDVTHTYAVAGNYVPTLTLVTNYGCNSSPAFPLTLVVNPIPRPNFTYSDTACLPVASVLFKNTTPGINNWVYNWNFDVPSTAALDNSVTQSNITHLYYTQAPHTVRLIATSVTTGCVDSIFKPIITIHPAPNASFAFTKPSVCIGDFVGVIDQSTFADGTASKWEWKWGDASISINPNPGTHTYAAANTYNVSLKVTNSWGCIDDSIRAFSVYAFPVVNAGLDSVILQGGSLVLTPTVTGNNLTYLWTGTPGPINLSNATVKNPTASPVEDITYKLTVTGQGGCPASDFVFIKVLKDPVVPNTFTPNNDGNHDTWIIRYLESYPENRVQVFTRAGQLIFESRRYLKPWDGTYNGKPLPIDTYYYIIEPGSGRKPLTGFVTIIK